jgi:hypothetical protein
MWEAQAHPEGFADLLAWVCEAALPEIEIQPLHISSEVLSSTEHRIVVVSKWRHSPQSLADPPCHLLIRDPQSWDFTPVDR